MRNFGRFVEHIETRYESNFGKNTVSLPDDSGQRPGKMELPDDSGRRPGRLQLPDDSGEALPEFLRYGRMH